MNQQNSKPARGNNEILSWGRRSFFSTCLIQPHGDGKYWSTRRRKIAITTVVLVSAAKANSALMSSHCCYSTRQHLQSPYTFTGHCDEREKSSRQSLPHALSMVSSLEAPMTNTSRRGRSRGKHPNDRKSHVKHSRSSQNDLRRKDLGLPVLQHLDLDTKVNIAEGQSMTRRLKQTHQLLNATAAKYENANSSTNSPNVRKNAPEIDSEILYEGIEKAPEENSKQKKAPSLQTSPIADAKRKINSNSSIASTNSLAKQKKPRKRGKSSTMPGFVKDDSLDEHITNKGLKMITSRRNVCRIVRTKAAKLKRKQSNGEAMYKKSASVPDSLLDYAQEIHSVSRVTPKEERELGTKTQEAMRLQRMYEDLQAKHGRNPTDSEWCAAAGKINMEALKDALSDGIEAKNQLVASNLRMVQRVVNLYIRNGLGSEYNAGDLMQDGTMALIRAAEKYEPDRGFRFSTYAMYWIRSAVKRSQTMQSRIVNVPQRIHETYKRVQKAEVKLRKELGREPTKSELASVCDITTVQLDRCRRAMQQASFSLDAEVQNTLKPNNSPSRKDTMYDLISSKADETEFEKTQRLIMKEHLISTLKRYLSPHEVDLLLLRYGLMDERALPTGMSGPMTIAEVSKLVGLKPDKVRRIIINSQRQLRHLMKEWEDYEFERT